MKVCSLLTSIVSPKVGDMRQVWIKVLVNRGSDNGGPGADICIIMA